MFQSFSSMSRLFSVLSGYSKRLKGYVFKLTVLDTSLFYSFVNFLLFSINIRMPNSFYILLDLVFDPERFIIPFHTASSSSFFFFFLFQFFFNEFEQTNPITLCSSEDLETLK